MPATLFVGAPVDITPLGIDRSWIDAIIEPSGLDGDFDRCAFTRRLSNIHSIATVVNP
jgi:hypothetical protein